MQVLNLFSAQRRQPSDQGILPKPYEEKTYTVNAYKMENAIHSIEPDVSLILQQINNPLTKIHLCLEILHNLHNDAESQYFYDMIKDSAHDIHKKVRTISGSINAPAANQSNAKQ